jgi:hypothetical protein
MNLLIILFMRLFSLINSLKPFEIQMHKAGNKKAWEAYLRRNRGDFIEDQEGLSDFRYGRNAGSFITGRTVGMDRIHPDGTIKGSANTCQVVAVYNALVAMEGRGCGVTPVEIIEYFEKKGLVLNGCLGSSPAAAVAFFKNRGYRTRFMRAGFLSGADYDRLRREYESFIFIAMNDRHSVFKGLHVMSVTGGRDGSLMLHNSGSKKEMSFDSLEEAVKSYNGGRGKPVGILAVRK